MYKDKHTHVDKHRCTQTHTHTHAHTHTHTHTQADYMQVQTNNLSQHWIFVAPNELTLEYSLHGKIIEFGGQF